MNKKIILQRLQVLLNQTYKLLPIRQQKMNWEKPLQTIIEQLAGMCKLLDDYYNQFFFSLLNKMEGLYLLTKEQDFLLYRRTIFECLSLMNIIQKEILCHQNH